MDSTSTNSSALWAANQQLYELRKQWQSHQSNDSLSMASKQAGDEITLTAIAYVATLPPHLGWESTAVTFNLRIAQKRNRLKEQEQRASLARQLIKEAFVPSVPENQPSPKTVEEQNQIKIVKSVKHYPSLGVGALQAKQVPHYQVWLACRALDVSGSGWLDLNIIRTMLTEKNAPLRLFGWRRLRQVLRQGNGRFWQWDKDKGRLWLIGAGRIADTLKVTRLAGRPVLLPIATLTNGVGHFKAHLYAAWHSGRRHDNPISRQVQRELTGVPERTQRLYCRETQIQVQPNLAIGERYTPENVEKRAWQVGRALFEFVDKNGRYGTKNGRYIAWQLPNSYRGPHAQTGKGRQRTINRQLADLVDKRAQGNGESSIERLYLPDGAAAAQVINRQATEAYWPIKSGHFLNFWCYFNNS